jgi:hypothetical protein
MTVPPVVDHLDAATADPGAVMADVHDRIASRFHRAEARTRACR